MSHGINDVPGEIFDAATERLEALFPDLVPNMQRARERSRSREKRAKGRRRSVSRGPEPELPTIDLAQSDAVLQHQLNLHEGDAHLLKEAKFFERMF